MATFTGKGSGTVGASSYTLKLDVWENRVDNLNNKSNVGWKLALDSGNYNFVDYSIPTKVNVDGEVYNASPRLSIAPNAEIVIASGNKDIYHDNNGSKTISCSASISNTSAYYLPGNINVSGNLKLTDIPRYANVNITEREKYINAISINWNADAARDHTQYNLNNAGWVDAYDTVMNDNKSGYFTISNLNPNTSYSIKVRVKRIDSQLWSESNTLNIITYDIARINEEVAKDLKIGVDYTLKYSNQSNADVKVAVMNIDKTSTIVEYKECSESPYIIQFNDDDIINLYKNFGMENTYKANLALKSIQNSKEYIDYSEINVLLTGLVNSVTLKVNDKIIKGRVWVGTSAGNKAGVFVVGTKNGNRRGI